jgi:D-alanyl-D-alanine dipeptidase
LLSQLPFRRAICKVCLAIASICAPSITPSRRRWRNLLVAAIGRQGFVNYSKEWWHFSLPGAGGEAYDFPIQPRRH